MAILASLQSNLFTSPPKIPKINEPTSSKPPSPPIPIPKYPKPQKTPLPTQNPLPNPKNRAFKSVHLRTKYYKPVSDGVIASEGDRSVVIGESGVSYLLPGAPFEFQFSYSEVPKVKPLAIREPAFLPFAPPTMNRPWTGKAPLKKSKKKIPLFDSFNPPPEGKKGVKSVEMPGPFKFGKFPQEGKTREEVLGEPLSKLEVKMLVKPHLSHNRQVNIGRDGLTHNMLELIHSHWKRQRVCKVRCRGVPTVDMDNICYHLEEKTGGKIIHRTGGVLYLFRGRNYNYRTRPQYPIMLWKPAAPVYPKLIQEAPEGLTKFEADDLRRNGKDLLPICKLVKNGIYVDLVKDVRNAFEGSPLVRINCRGLEPSDYKKVGAKLKELVPCVLLSFDEEHILMWRGKDWTSMYSNTPSSAVDSSPPNNGIASALDGLDLNEVEESASAYNGNSDYEIQSTDTNVEIVSHRIASLWKHAIESSKALLLDEVELGPDSLLEKVEAFEGSLQVTEHSYPALILTNEDDDDSLKTDHQVGSDFEMHYDNYDEDDFDGDGDEGYVADSFEDAESSLPLGSLPVDSITDRFAWE